MIPTHFSKLNPLGLSVIFLLLVIPRIETVTAQTAAPTPKSAEVLRLEEEKAQAELRKAIAEANKAELEAKFPKPISSPLAGTTTINDGAIIESQIVAYIALARAANKLVSNLSTNSDLKVSKLAVFNEEDIKLLLSHKTTRSQLEVLRQSYCQLLAAKQTNANDCPNEHKTDPNALVEPDSFVPPLTIARSLLGSFVDLTSFLRTNVEIKGQTFDIDEAPLVAEVFRASRRRVGGLNNAQLFYPKVYPPDFEPNKQYFILGAIEVVLRLRNTASRLIEELEKNAADLGRADTRVDTLRASVNSLTLARASAMDKLKNIVIPAHCPDVPECDTGNPTAVAARLRKYCPKLTGEQREIILELANRIRQLDSDLAAAQLSLVNAQNAQARLDTDRARLWETFNSEIGGRVNAISVANIAGQLKARNDQFDKFIAGLVQAGTGGGSNALTSLLKAENIQAALNADSQGKSYWLQLKVVRAGGNNRIKTNLLWDVFTGGNRVSHSGGVIVEYILYETTGRAVASDTITEYTDYIKSHKVRKLPSLEVDDFSPLPKKNEKKSESVVADQR